MKSAVSRILNSNTEHPGNFNRTPSFNKIQTISPVEYQEDGEGKEAGGKGNVVAELLRVSERGVVTMATILT